MDEFQVFFYHFDEILALEILDDNLLRVGVSEMSFLISPEGHFQCYKCFYKVSF